MDQTIFLSERTQVRLELKAALGRKLPTDGRIGAWSPGEVFHHILLTNQSSQNLLSRLFAKAKNLPLDPLVDWPVRPELRDFPQDKAFSIVAFPGTEPEFGLGGKDLESIEIRVDAGFRELLELTSRFRLEALSFPHPLAGRMNFYEWLVFGVVHERLHLDLLLKDLGPA